jgi:hypothetical protein
MKDAQEVLSIEQIGIDLRKKSRNYMEVSQELLLAEYFTGGELASGEIGCLLSHQEAYKFIVDGNHDWALIIEDDAEIASTITSVHLLNSMADWNKRGYELVHLSPTKGGVVLYKNNQRTGKAIVPPLHTNAYWISSKGAQKLRTSKNIIGGLADWPIQITRVKIRATITSYFLNSGMTNSVINPTRKKPASSRIEISFRKLQHIFLKSNSKILFISLRNYGISCTVKYVLVYRIYQRLARIVSKKKKGLNETIFLKY